MSLDIYLTLAGVKSNYSGSGIFIREAGQTKEISRLEWDKKHPGQEPFIAQSDNEGEVYHANITHNLGRMAKEAGLYRYIWRPDEYHIKKAYQLVAPLTVGLQVLENSPKRFEKFNPLNGWGDYKGLIEFTRNYLAACEQYPGAEIYTSR